MNSWANTLGVTIRTSAAVASEIERIRPSVSLMVVPYCQRRHSSAMPDLDLRPTRLRESQGGSSPDKSCRFNRSMQHPSGLSVLLQRSYFLTDRKRSALHNVESPI